MQAETESQLNPAMRDRIKAIAADIFQTDVEKIDLAMGPGDIAQWDSLNHLRLITEIENSFSLHLTMQEIQQIESLEVIATFVSRNTGALPRK